MQRNDKLKFGDMNYERSNIISIKIWSNKEICRVVIGTNGISSRVESSGTGRRKRNTTVYDIVYQYEVNGEFYSDELNGRTKIRLVGDEIKVKYNPEKPEISTTIMSPSLSDMIVFLVFGAVFCTLGFFLSGIYALIRRIRRRGAPEEEEVLPPEEYVDPKTIKKVPNTFGTVFVRRILPMVIILGGIFLSTRLFSGTQAIDAEQFKSTVEAEGYTTTDTTDKLRQEWRVGSMMEEAVSFDDGNIRMDFCVMDTVDSAGNLYYGMTLPLSEGEEIEQSGMVHEIHSIESDTLYIAKVRIRNTVLYVSALAEYKAEVQELLETLGYWKD